MHTHTIGERCRSTQHEIIYSLYKSIYLRQVVPHIDTLTSKCTCCWSHCAAVRQHAPRGSPSEHAFQLIRNVPFHIHYTIQLANMSSSSAGTFRSSSAASASGFVLQKWASGSQSTYTLQGAAVYSSGSAGGSSSSSSLAGRSSCLRRHHKHKTARTHNAGTSLWLASAEFGLLVNVAALLVLCRTGYKSKQ